MLAAYAAGDQALPFQPGDFVEVRDGESWQRCVVSGKYRPESRDYPVSCGPRDLFAPSGSARIRARKPAPEDFKIASETAAALALLPRPGHRLGARYGTREPRLCGSRTEPAAGAILPAQAKQYFICEAEAEGATSLVLVTNVKIEVAPGRVFNSQTDSGHAGIEPTQKVYDIRGSYTHYDCRQPSESANAFTRTHNCNAFEEPAAQGLCFKSTFGDWHCVMHDMHADILNPRQYLLPPTGN